MTPQISIVIPTYNRADYLAETLDSVLVQSFKEYELIIVDDGSTDDTFAVVSQRKHPNLHYVYQKNAGGSSARNNGFAKSQGNYILFLDSDDLLLPDALEMLWCAALADPSAGLIAGRYQYIDAKGQYLGEPEFWDHLEERIDLESLVLACPFIPSATLIRRDCFTKVGGFDINQVAAQDWDLWLRMAATDCLMRPFKRSVSKYRLHASALTIDLERQKRGYLRALDKHFGDCSCTASFLAIRGAVYANAYLHIAAREYAAGQIEKAQRDLMQAGEFAPDWVNSGILLERLLKKGQSPTVTDEYKGYISQVLDHLPAKFFTAKSRKRALARVAAASLFADYRHCDRTEIAQLWWEVALNDPAWLCNSGFCLIGLRGLLGPKTVFQIKKAFGR